MTEEALEKRLKELSTKGARTDFIKGLDDQILTVSRSDDLFPDSCLEALDGLLKILVVGQGKKIRPKERRKQVALVESHYHDSVKPYKIVVDNENYISYPYECFGKQFTLLNVRADGLKDPKNLQLEVRLKDKTITFTYYTLDELHVKKRELNDYRYGIFFKRKASSNSVGVAIKKTSKDGTFNLFERYSLGSANACKYVIIFFDEKGKHYYFDLFGEMLFPRLCIEDVVEQKRLEKAIDIEERMKELDPIEYSLMIAEQVKQNWQKNPSEFKGRIGWHYIIDGHYETKTCRNGDTTNGFYYNGKLKSHFGVLALARDKQRTMEVKLRLCGPYITIYDENGIVNGFEYEGPAGFKKARLFDISNLRIVSARTIGRTKTWQYSVGGTSYHFNPTKIGRELKEQYNREITSEIDIGILANTLTNKFELLLRDNGKLLSISITPHYVTKTRKYREVQQKG